jgi:hypothetical protein
MCPNCFSAGVASFPSYWEFEAFETKLQHKLMRQQLIPLSLALTQEPAAMAPEQLYQCSSCGEAWAISSPDNAWRGYFLPLAEATALQCHQQQRNRKRPIGCLALVLALAGFIIWRLFA